MRKLLLCSIAALSFTLIGCDKVPAGHVGVKVNLLGSDKGVDTQELGTGRYWIGFNEELYLFPTFSQNKVWDAKSGDSDTEDQTISFQTKEGLKVTTAIGVTYNIKSDKVTTIFQKYRKGIDEITDIYLRNMIRDALVIEASTRPIESVYGVGKADLIAAAESRVRKQVDSLGINVERIYWVGDLGLPDTVVAAINAKINATQKAAQRENEVAQAKAEADKAIETARGEAESRLKLAQAEAESIRIKGEALAENPKLVELSAIEKWNGVLPIYTMSNATPFINVPVKQ
jgi:regulator of protease activity HflC (stomatin/prohibitin superfamily)